MDVKVTDDKTVVTHPNTKATYTVQRALGGTGMWCVVVDTGTLPKHLTGLYTSSKGALRALTIYLGSIKETPTVRRDKNAAERMERKKANGSEVRTEGGQ